MHGYQALNDRQAEARALFGALDGNGALAEGREHDGDLVGRNAGSIVLDGDVLPATCGPAHAHPHFAACWGKLDRVGEQVEGDLSNSAFVCEQARQGRLEILDRKSTRLNSSHVKISYAVVCLN